MAKKPQSLIFKQHVDAPPRQAYEAFTSATAFTEWLCDAAQTDPHVGGRLYLYWQAGYYASGDYIALKPERRVAFSWHGRGEPGLSHVDIRFKPDGSGTRITLSHNGLGTGKAWKRTRKQIGQGWKRGLKNLKSILETGMDLRMVEQPLLGVVGLEELSAEQSEKLGLPGRGGVRLVGIVEGMSADLAGLKAGDVIVKFDGGRVNAAADLTDGLNTLRVGDEVKITYYRETQKDALKLKLHGRPLPDIPPSADALGSAVGRMYASLDANLEACLVGVTDREADFRPGTDEMNVKAILAHLIASERGMHAWVASMIDDQEAGFTFHVDQPTRLAATVTAFPSVPDLLSELQRNQVETVAMAAGLPEEFVDRKRTYWRLAYNLLSTPYHYHEHCKQIQMLIADARRGADEKKEGEL
jgi:uncharacterized protein YndB with AHSA1/START domain